MEVKKSVTLKRQAYDAIRTAILQRELSRDQIYSEQWFADELHISRTPVREALLQLRNEGLIDVLPNRGVIIKPVTLKDAENVYQMRAAIEGYCAAYLARHAKEKSGIAVLDQIELLLERCHQNFSYSDEVQFHYEIIQYTQNQEFIGQYSRMRAKMDIFWNEIVGKENRHAEIYKEHKAILESMRAGNPDGARAASEKHLMIVFEKIQQGDLLSPF